MASGNDSDPLHVLSAEQLAIELQECLVRGDTEMSKDLADQLARRTANLKITAEKRPDRQTEPAISLNVNVEDRHQSGSSFIVMVRPSDTIKDLKRMIREKYHFPEEVQRWIIGKHLPTDEETLASCEICTSGCSVFLYLRSARSVGLTRAEYEKHHGCHKSIGLKVHAMIPAVGAVNGAMAEVGDGSDSAAGYSERGWECPACTYINLPTRPGCELCAMERPDDYVVPDLCAVPESERQRLLQEKRTTQQLVAAERQMKDQDESMRIVNFQQLLATDEQDLILNVEQFDCPICFDSILPGEGVVVRECLHSFCRECLKSVVQHNDQAQLGCPYQDNNYSCLFYLQEREIKALVPTDLYERFLQQSLSIAETQTANSYHCITPNCIGWCIYEDAVHVFHCPACKKSNCLTCKVIHQGRNCKEYQDDIANSATHDLAAMASKDMLDNLLAKGEAMRCPKCTVIIQKNGGCDNVTCAMCKSLLNWAQRFKR